MTDPLVAATGLHKAFGRTVALRGASLTIEPGERVAITGPSGSGKSTLLQCIAGVIAPEAGTVTFDGTRVDALSADDRTRLRRREIGLVLQFGRLVPELTALENVALPLLLERRDRHASATVARGWLAHLGVEECAESLASDLSGGEGQRVAIARALITAPKLVLADEPTGALDTVGAERTMQVLVEATGDIGAALVVVTHDNRVAAFADREVVLRDGRTDAAKVVA
ncbi:ABC transporter ATP-binding protein [Mumia sp. ZJ430]|uniref:ABC transporter ATP-binding protein n=1 Tax=Mumia sp. ZJ430 TaxID=2708083 RepID=UPI00142374FE|nr:ABC transporter ATP-binding protein [Mumia sp. ZJ430]